MREEQHLASSIKAPSNSRPRFSNSSSTTTSKDPPNGCVVNGARNQALSVSGQDLTKTKKRSSPSANRWKSLDKDHYVSHRKRQKILTTTSSSLIATSSKFFTTTITIKFSPIASLLLCITIIITTVITIHLYFTTSISL